jgi:hypothetical protein
MKRKVIGFLCTPPLRGGLSHCRKEKGCCVGCRGRGSKRGIPIKKRGQMQGVRLTLLLEKTKTVAAYSCERLLFLKK